MAVVIGAVLGVFVGAGLSVYVGRLDYQKRQSGVRVQAQYRLSLIVVPLLLGALGAGIGALIAAI